MKTLATRVLLSTLALTLVVAVPFVQAQAQDKIKPAAVISIASIDEQFEDAGYLLDAAGFGAFQLFLDKATLAAGFKTSKPMGSYVLLRGMEEEPEPEFVAFFPVEDLDAVLGRFANQISETDVEGKKGVKKITGPDGQDAYLKTKGDWAFASNAIDNLDTLPDDPVKILGDLPKNYNLAIQINVQNIPKDIRDQAVEQMKQGFQESLEFEDDPDTREMTEKLGQGMLNSLVEVVEQSEQVTLGWAIDKATKNTYIDVDLTAIPNSKMAERMALLQDTKSGFSGFLLPDAAVMMNLISKMTKEDKEITLSMFKVMRTKAMQELDNDEDLDADERAAAKDVMGSLFEIAEKTIQSGKIDGGAVVMLSPDGITVAGGGYIADGKSMEGLLRKVAELAKDEPEFPGIKFNADTHANVRFHTLKLPVPADAGEDVRNLLGDELEVAIGTGDKSFYLAFGKDSVGTLKKVIDQSAADAQKVVKPSQVSIAVLPIAKFAAAVSGEEAVGKVVEALEQVMEKDKIVVSSSSIANGRGGRTRIEIQEGVLKAIGAGVQASGFGAPGF